ncbi:D-isomer specific 2-hydroxyacid dehydrogenase family protein, partial [Pseudomonas syringae pv. japonica str. M301072]
YTQLLRKAAPDLEVFSTGDSAELSRMARDMGINLIA